MTCRGHLEQKGIACCNRGQCCSSLSLLQLFIWRGSQAKPVYPLDVATVSGAACVGDEERVHCTSW